MHQETQWGWDSLIIASDFRRPQPTRGKPWCIRVTADKCMKMLTPARAERTLFA